MSSGGIYVGTVHTGYLKGDASRWTLWWRNCGHLACWIRPQESRDAPNPTTLKGRGPAPASDPRTGPNIARVTDLQMSEERRLRGIWRLAEAALHGLGIRVRRLRLGGFVFLLAHPLSSTCPGDLYEFLIKVK